MKGEIDGAVLVVALRLDDEALAQRVASALASIPGFRLATDGDKADLVVTAAPAGADPEAPLTQRA